jgi:hypothetical protein
MSQLQFSKYVPSSRHGIAASFQAVARIIAQVSRGRTPPRSSPPAVQPRKQGSPGNQRRELPNLVASGCRALRVAHEPVVTEDRSPSGPAGSSRCQVRTIVVLAGRATSVPAIAVMTGPERTATDNARAASTCAVPCLRRPRARPIWLWEQGVNRCLRSIWSGPFDLHGRRCIGSRTIVAASSRTWRGDGHACP